MQNPPLTSPCSPHWTLVGCVCVCVCGSNLSGCVVVFCVVFSYVFLVFHVPLSLLVYLYFLCSCVLFASCLSVLHLSIMFSWVFIYSNSLPLFPMFPCAMSVYPSCVFIYLSSLSTVSLYSSITITVCIISHISLCHINQFTQPDSFLPPYRAWCE